VVTDGRLHPAHEVVLFYVRLHILVLRNAPLRMADNLQDDVALLGQDGIRKLSNLQPKCRVLKHLTQLPTLIGTQIAAVRCSRTVTRCPSQLRKVSSCAQLARTSSDGTTASDGGD